MVIAFKTINLRDICENKEIAERELGKKKSIVLKHRLADLISANSIYTLPLGNPQIVNQGTEEILTIDLNNEGKIYLIANHTNNPKTKTGTTDWNKINRLKIVDIK